MHLLFSDTMDFVFYFVTVYNFTVKILKSATDDPKGNSTKSKRKHQTLSIKQKRKLPQKCECIVDKLLEYYYETYDQKLKKNLQRA